MYKGYFKYESDSEPHLICSSEDINEVIRKSIAYAESEASYCLDSKEVRTEALKTRHFCICGCGPSEIFIESDDEVG